MSSILLSPQRLSFDLEEHWENEIKVMAYTAYIYHSADTKDPKQRLLYQLNSLISLMPYQLGLFFSKGLSCKDKINPYWRNYLLGVWANLFTKFVKEEGAAIYKQDGTPYSKEELIGYSLGNIKTQRHSTEIPLYEIEIPSSGPYYAEQSSIYGEAMSKAIFLYSTKYSNYKPFEKISFEDIIKREAALGKCLDLFLRYVYKRKGLSISTLEWQKSHGFKPTLHPTFYAKMLESMGTELLEREEEKVWKWPVEIYDFACIIGLL